MAGEADTAVCMGSVAETVEEVRHENDEVAKFSCGAFKSLFAMRGGISTGTGPTSIESGIFYILSLE